MTEKSDAELVKNFQSGDPDAFDAIVRRFQNRVYRLACVWLKDAQHADDATQEVFLRAFRGLRRFGFKAAPFTWLYRTTRYVCNEFNRRRPMDPLGTEPPDTGDTPHHKAGEQDTVDRIREIVSMLPARQQEVVMLRVFEDLSVAETARVMRCREGTVKALLHKAKLRLRLDAEKVGLMS